MLRTIRKSAFAQRALQVWNTNVPKGFGKFYPKDGVGAGTKGAGGGGAKSGASSSSSSSSSSTNPPKGSGFGVGGGGGGGSKSKKPEWELDGPKGVAILIVATSLLLLNADAKQGR